MATITNSCTWCGALNTTHYAGTTEEYELTLDSGTSPYDVGASSITINSATLTITFAGYSGTGTESAEYSLTVDTPSFSYLTIAGTKTLATLGSGYLTKEYGGTYTGVTYFMGESIYSYFSLIESSGVTSLVIESIELELDYTYTQNTSHSVTIDSSITGGTVSASPASAVSGTTINLTFAPNTGYQLYSWRYNGTTGSGTSFTMPDANVTISATFTKISYTISRSITNGTHGSVTIPSSAYYGDTVSMTLTPDTGYSVSWTYNGTTGSGTSFTMPASDIIVAVTFSKISYDVKTSVSTSSTGNGTVSASPTSAGYGDTVTLTFTPATGSHLSSWTLNGTTKTGTTFTMPNAIANVVAIFDEDSITLTTSGGSGGSISLSSSSATYDDTITITSSPSTGCELSSLYYTINNSSTQYPISTSSLSFNVPDAGNTGVVTIYYSFSAIQYTISGYDGGTNGSVSGPSSEYYGASVTLTFTPNSGYELDSWTYTYNGHIYTGSGTSFIMPAYNVTAVTATFVASGTLSLSASQTTLYKDSYYYDSSDSTATLTAGFAGSSVSISNVTLSGWSSSVISVNASTGVVTAVGVGTTTVTGTYLGTSASVTFTVSAYSHTLTLSRSSITNFYTGETASITATYTSKKGSTTVNTSTVTSSATWSTSNSARATVSYGTVTAGSSSGSSTITCSYGGLSATCSVTTSVFTYSLVVTLASSSIESGATTTATAYYKKWRGSSLSTSTNVTSSATWSTSNSSVATVSGGTVTGGATAGSARITATYNGYSDYDTLTVTLAVVSTVYGTPTITEFTCADIPATGGSISSASTLTYTQTKTVTYSDNSTSTSTITSGASVSYGSAVTSGAATAGASRTQVGTLTVTITLNGQTANSSCAVYIASNTLADGTLSISCPSAVVGETASITATITYLTGETADVTSSTTFTSGDTGIATVSGSTVTGVASGTVTMTGVYSEKTATCSTRVGTAAEMTQTVYINNTTPDYGTISVTGETLTTVDTNWSYFTTSYGSTPVVTFTPSSSSYTVYPATYTYGVTVPTVVTGSTTTICPIASVSKTNATDPGSSSRKITKLVGQTSMLTTQPPYYTVTSGQTSVATFTYNISSIPSDATVTGISVTYKGYVGTNITSNTISATNGSGTTYGTASLTTSVAEGSITISDLTALSSTFNVTVSATCSSSSGNANAKSVSIYGLYLTVTYGYPTPDPDNYTGGTETDITRQANTGSYTMPAVTNTGVVEGTFKTQSAGTGQVIISDWTYNSTASTEIPVSLTNGTSGVEYTWYSKSGSTYTELSSKPTSTSTPGTYAVKAYFPATSDYTEYITDYVDFDINKLPCSLTISPSSAKIYNRSGYNTVQITYSSNHGDVSFSSGDTSVATVNSSGVVTYVSEAVVTITVTDAGNDYYESGSVTCSVDCAVDKVSSEVIDTTTYCAPTSITFAKDKICAGGGVARPLATVTNIVTYHYVYNSGYVEATSSRTRNSRGTVGFRITSRTPDSDSAWVVGSDVSENVESYYLSHRDMNRTAATDTCTLVAYNVDSSSLVSDSVSWSITNKLESTHYNYDGEEGDEWTYGTPGTPEVTNNTYSNWCSSGSGILSASATDRRIYYLRYTSGAFDTTQYSENVAATIVYEKTSDQRDGTSGSYWTLSDYTLTHVANMGTTVATDTCTIIAKNANSTSKKSSALTVTASNTFTVGAPDLGKTSIVYGGDDYTTVSATAQYTSGSEVTITIASNFSTNPSDVVDITDTI